VTFHRLSLWIFTKKMSDIIFIRSQREMPNFGCTLYNRGGKVTGFLLALSVRTYIFTLDELTDTKLKNIKGEYFFLEHHDSTKMTVILQYQN
jgi:hypothetical protein